MNTCTRLSIRSKNRTNRSLRACSVALQHRNALVEKHRHLVPPLARHYWRRCAEPQEDLIQVGLLGLIRAAELFSPSHQTPFAAFARPHIRGAILHYLRDDALSVRLPRRQAELHSRLLRLEDLMARSPRSLSEKDAEIRQLLEITPDQWQLLKQHRQLCRPAPLDGALMEQLASPPWGPLEDSQESHALVDSLLSALDPRTQKVVRWVVLQGWSYRKAAAALEVSAMTVQRCLQKGLATMRLRFDETNPSPTPCRKGAVTPGLHLDRDPSASRGWPSRHSPPPTAAPGRHARK